MTIIASTSLAPAARAGRSASLMSLALCLVLCLVLGAMLTADRAAQVWSTGAFFDTDDAMRVVQVRNWLAGEGWFDLTVARVDPPAGLAMHWSRVVDVPLAALTEAARLALPPELAERAARLAFPLAMLAALYLACAYAATRIVKEAGPAAVALAFLGAPMMGQFIPGRIDHHAPQIVLLTLMAGAMLEAIEPSRARMAAWAGVCAALSLAISLENLPFVAIVALVPALAFVAQGERATGVLVSFAGSLAASLAALFLATVPRADGAATACDAFSEAHLAVGLAGCAALALLATLRSRLPTVASRAAAFAVVAPAPVAALLLTAPRCFGDPFVGLDPLVREVWLRNVSEVEPLASFLVTHPWSALALCGPMAAGVVAALVLAAREPGVARARFALIAALLAMSLAASAWGVRTLSSGLPLVAVVGAALVLRAGPALTGAGRLAARALAALPFAPLALAFALPSDPPSRWGGDSLACLTPRALAPMAALPKGLVFAPTDAGSHILALTPHAVLGAPYHRDNHGNRLTLDAFLADPDAARTLVEGSGADYLAICGDQVQARIIAARAPNGLAARLLAGQAPSWLEKLPGDGPQALYRVR